MSDSPAFEKNKVYSFRSPLRFQVINSIGGFSFTNMNEIFIEFIGLSQISEKHVFMETNEKKFIVIDDYELQHVKEIV